MKCVFFMCLSLKFFLQHSCGCLWSSSSSVRVVVFEVLPPAFTWLSLKFFLQHSHGCLWGSSSSVHMVILEILPPMFTCLPLKFFAISIYFTRIADTLHIPTHKYHDPAWFLFLPRTASGVSKFLLTLERQPNKFKFLLPTTCLVQSPNSECHSTNLKVWSRCHDETTLVLVAMFQCGYRLRLSSGGGQNSRLPSQGHQLSRPWSNTGASQAGSSRNRSTIPDPSSSRSSSHLSVGGRGSKYSDSSSSLT